MAGSATITGKQHYTLGIGHSQNQTDSESLPIVFNSLLRPVQESAFASSFTNVDNSASQTNYCQLIMMPVKYSAVRIGWPQMGGNGALTGLRAVVAATDEIGDLTYTNTVPCKKFITPMRNGVEYNSLSPTGWQAVTWGGAATGSASDAGADLIDVAWSDIIPVQAVPLASDPTNRFSGWYPLLVRVYPGSGFFSRCSYVGFSDPAKFLAECGPAVVLGANRGGGDYVATLASWSQASTPAYSDSTVLPLVIEAYSEGRTPTIIVTGDSRFASAPTAEAATNAYRSTCFRMEQIGVDEKLKVLRSCQGGKTTSIYFQRSTEILDSGEIQPNVSVYLGYSINDGSPTFALLSAAKSKVLQHVNKCKKLNIQPVIVSIFPNGSGYGSALPDVLDFDSFCANLNVPMVSPLQLYGNSAGGWLPGLSDDGTHMLDYTDLANNIYKMCKPYLV